MDWSPFFISMKTAVMATIFTFFFSIFVASKVMKIKGKLSWILDGIFSLPLVLPPTVVGFFLLLLLGKRGPMGSFLEGFGIQIVFQWPATVIAAVVISFPLMYQSTKTAFEQVDENVINAGRTLGLSERKIFWKIRFPLGLPGVISGSILAFARSLGEFGATLMIAGNIPKITQTIPVAIYMAVQSNNMKEGKIWVSIMIGISFLAICVIKGLGKSRKE